MEIRLKFFALILLVAFFPGRLRAESWCFGIIPDTQWSREDPSFHGVAVPFIEAINEQFLHHRVDFVLAVGDLVNQPTPEAFAVRAQCNRSLLDAGIAFYPLRGNHDSSAPGSLEHFSAAFPDLPGTPGNGGSSPDLPHAAGKTYALTHKGIKFILLDSFPLIEDGSKKGKSYSVADYLPWIEKELKMDDHRAAFVFSHLGLVGQKHKSNLFGKVRLSQNNLPLVQNEFFSCLQDNGVKYHFCGHDHLYHRAEIKSPDGKSRVQQIICGSASDKFYRPKFPFTRRETPISQECERIGFLIVHIRDELVRVEYYSAEPFDEQLGTPPVWELRETFGYNTSGGGEFSNTPPEMKNFDRPSIPGNITTEETASFLHTLGLLAAVSLAIVVRDRRYLPFLFVFLCFPVLLNFRYPWDSPFWDAVLEGCCMLLGFSGLVIRALSVGYSPNEKGILQTRGMYSLLRHPLYVGNYLLWLPPVLFLHSVWLCLIYTLMFVLYYRGVVFREESDLFKRFGPQYSHWAARTPIFLPNVFQWQKPEHPFSWKAAIRSEYHRLFLLIVVMSSVEHIGDYVIKGAFSIDTAWVSIFLFGSGLYLVMLLLLMLTGMVRRTHNERVPP